MRRLILILIFLLLSVWFGLTVLRHPGFVFLVYQPWMVQMPLWFAVISLFVIFVLFYFVVTGIDHLQFAWFRLKNWWRFRSEHRSYSKTQHGLTMLIEGRWKKAERLLLGGIHQSIEPLMNYLGAARAAHELKAYVRRDDYIQKAYQMVPDAEMAIGMTQAELEMMQEHYERAVAILNQLRKKSPRNPGVLKLLEKVYVRSADWRNLLTLLPSLRKTKLLTAEQYQQFEKNVYCEILRTEGNTLEAIDAIWRNMPRSARKNADVACAYVKQLLALHLPNNQSVNKEIEETIRKTLKAHWQPELAEIYGTLPFTNLNRQLVIVGAWLKLYGEQAAILLTLGRLCVKVQLWGKAKDYFERCLALGPSPAASLEYGKLMEQLGDADEAIKKYREGLQPGLGSSLTFKTNSVQY
jgi:HemY protein